MDVVLTNFNMLETLVTGSRTQTLRSFLFTNNLDQEERCPAPKCD